MKPKAKPFLFQDKKAGDKVLPNTYFLGWCCPKERGENAVECHHCSGFAERVDSTKEEILSDINCGKTRACCCVAFVCKKCKRRWVGQQPAPECG